MKNHTPPHTLAPPLQPPGFTSLLRWMVFSLLAVFAPVLQAAVAPPTVDTLTSVSITSTAATLGATVADNGDPVTLQGVVISATDPDPAIGVGDAVNIPDDVAGAGVFTVDVINLVPGTLYTFKAYAQNSGGLTYSAPATFTTDDVPTVNTLTSTSITSTSATLGATVAENGDPVILQGVVISATDPEPAIGVGDAVNIPDDAPGAGAFTVDASELVRGTEYFFRAYAQNGLGLVYSAASSFTTDDIPTVTTPTKTPVGGTTATIGGNVELENGDAVTERGVMYWKTSAGLTPVIGDVNGLTVFKSTTTGTTGVFTVALTGLSVGTEYTFKAYATNAVGTGYTDADTFETTHTAPTIAATPTSTDVTTDAATAVSSATLGGNVTLAGAEFIERGVVYMLSSDGFNPQIGGENVTQVISEDTAGTTGAFTVAATGLLPYRQYYFYAYVKNDAGTVYSSTRGNFTPPAVAPLVDETPTKDAIGSTGATLGGTVTNTGGRTLDEVGVLYSSTVEVPTYGATGVLKSNATSATGVFTKAVTGLTANTTYFYRAFAKTAAGTTYSNVDSFTTSASVPTLSLPTKTSVLATSATLGGTVNSTGGSGITARGVVYSVSSENADPQLLGTGVTAVPGTGTTGVLTVPVTGLTPNTTYSFKAYATNGVGTGYTAVATFTTPAGKPTVTSPTSAAIEETIATLGGNVTEDNGAEITERGVVYSVFTTNSNPVIGGTGVTKATTSGTTGVFTVDVTGLVTGKKYAFKAYAKNAKGVTYTAAASFTTDPSEPTVASPSKGNITSTKATLGGTVTKNNGAVVTARGVVYSATATNSNPLIDGTGVTRVAAATAGNGSFSVGVTGLTPGTAYSFKAFATNSVGTSYTAVGTFTTPAAPPTITSPTSAGIGSTTATLGGNVTKDNGATITERGVVYSLTATSPSIDSSKKAIASGTTGVFTVAVSNLKPAKKYYFRAYAKNAKGIRYTTVGTFTTDPAAPSIASTPTKTDITATSAKIGGKGIKANGSTITERGVVYSLTSANDNPRINGAGVINKTTTSTLSSFAIVVKGLTSGRSYSFAAYAKNALGTTYSDVGTFTTLDSSASVLAGAPAADAAQTYYTTDAATGLKYLTIVVEKAAGTSPVVEVSGNLTDWFSGSSHTTVVSDDAGVLVVRDNTPVTTGVKRYIRVKP